jgi:transposase-like protein
MNKCPKCGYFNFKKRGSYYNGDLLKGEVWYSCNKCGYTVTKEFKLNNDK